MKLEAARLAAEQREAAAEKLAAVLAVSAEEASAATGDCEAEFTSGRYTS